MSEERKELDREYVQALTPDKMKLALYVNRAKGVERTMAQFAEACGVSASTLSRIVNGKITKPIAEDLLRKIVENSAEEDMPLDIIMRANGMVPKDLHEQRSMMGYNHWERREAAMNAENIAKNTIADELFARGHMIQFFQRLPVRELPSSEFALGNLSSFAIHMQGYDPRYWNFILCTQTFNQDDERDRREMISFNRRIMDRYASIFLRDAWEPENFSDVKTSFVFIDPVLYTMFEDLILKATVNSEMSIILLDTEKQKVLTEVMIPRHKGSSGSSVFAEEIIVQDNEDDFWNDDDDKF